MGSSPITDLAESFWWGETGFVPSRAGSDEMLCEDADADIALMQQWEGCVVPRIGVRGEMYEADDGVGVAETNVGRS
jgi:hypothetical protein